VSINDDRERFHLNDKCRRLRKLFYTLPNDTPRLLEFCNRVGSLEAAAKDSSDRIPDALVQLDQLMTELKSADDGQGKPILEMTRWEQFFSHED
jgi:hypothetical protein